MGTRNEKTMGGMHSPPCDTLAAIAETVPALLGYVDATERYRYVNPAYQGLFRRPVAEIVGRPVAEVMGTAAFESVGPRLRRALAGERQEVELELVNARGEERVVEAQLVPHRGEDGDGVVVFASDVTLRKALERRANRAGRLEALGEMAGAVAHDFRNLLTAILLPCQLMRLYAPDQVDEDLKTIELACGRAEALAERLVAFAQYGHRVREPIDVNEALSSLTPIVRHLLGSGSEWVLDLEDRSAFVLADRVELEQIVLNLAVNARHAMPEGGTLRVSTRLSEGPVDPDRLPQMWVTLDVTDTGIGMDDATKAKIFDAQFTTRRERGGSGLGLRTVQRTVGSLGGAVSVESELGLGTRFTIRLPVARFGP